MTDASTPEVDTSGPLGPAIRERADLRFGRLPGRHALSIALADGSRLRRDAGEPYPAASLVKLPLLVLALAAAARGELDLSERLPVGRHDLAGGSGLLRDLDDGISPTWRDLLTLMIVVSDNTATNLVLDRLGVERVNAALASIGMPSTRIAGPLQVDEARWTAAQRAGERATTTARDVHELLTRLDDGRLLAPEATAWARSRLVAQRHRDAIPRHLTGDAPSVGALAVGAKGGWLDAARHDAGIVWEGERRIATIVVLSADHPQTRFGPDHPATLATAALAYDAVELARRSPARYEVEHERGSSPREDPQGTT